MWYFIRRNSSPLFRWLLFLCSTLHSLKGARNVMWQWFASFHSRTWKVTWCKANYEINGWRRWRFSKNRLIRLDSFASKIFAHFLLQCISPCPSSSASKPKAKASFVLLLWQAQVKMIQFSSSDVPAKSFLIAIESEAMTMMRKLIESALSERLWCIIFK